jgi:S-adenosylmethionine:tRNA ribosyltransferase-isomerase
VADELDAYDFALPPEQIAQEPTPERDGARLLVLDRASDALAHRRVRDLPSQLRPGDLLVVNATRVLPARLRGHKTTGGAAEVLLLGSEAGGFRALVRAPGRLRPGLKLVLGGLDAEVTEVAAGGEVRLVFPEGSDPYAVGETPLPPYIRRGAANPEDAERYQTVFARAPGSVAAPTAGLHLSRALLDAVRAAGAEVAEVILHVGLGTFRPLRPEDLARGHLHDERYELPEETAAAVARARERGGRVVAVGTTATRVLEARARDDRSVEPGAGTTGLFLRPASPDAAPLPFRCVDALLTNFHLPRSSLLLLVCAFAGRRRVLDAYAEAMRAGYRFYSYGDAMLLA